MAHVAKCNIVDTRGYYIPKGTVMASNMYAMHQNPDAFSDPEKFIPERFMNNIKTMSSSANSGIELRDQYNFGWGRYVAMVSSLVFMY